MTPIPRAVVVMGVSGAGKSEIGSAVAERLGQPFIDADDLHPAANIAKMAQGRPLDDADRLPWLDAVATAPVRQPAVRQSGYGCLADTSLTRRAGADAIHVAASILRA